MSSKEGKINSNMEIWEDYYEWATPQLDWQEEDTVKEIIVSLPSLAFSRQAQAPHSPIKCWKTVFKVLQKKPMKT